MSDGQTQREREQLRNVCSFPETEEILNNGSDNFRNYLVETGEGERKEGKEERQTACSGLIHWIKSISVQESLLC